MIVGLILGKSVGTYEATRGQRENKRSMYPLLFRLNLIHFSIFSKRWCVFPMVIWLEFPMGQYRVNNHPYHAPQFILKSIIIRMFPETPFLVALKRAEFSSAKLPKMPLPVQISLGQVSPSQFQFDIANLINYIFMQWTIMHSFNFNLGLKIRHHNKSIGVDIRNEFTLLIMEKPED